MIAPPLTGNPYGDHESREGLLVSATVTSKWAKGAGGPSGNECQNLVAHTLRAEGFDAGEDGTGRGTPIIPFDTTQITSKENRCNPQPNDPCHPIAAQGHPPTIAFQAKASASQSMNPAPVAPTLDSSKIGGMSVLSNNVRLRRLTPLECERLMGLPDHYTAIPYKGKPMADGPRYKLLGNSIAINCLRWIGERIALWEKVTAP